MTSIDSVTLDVPEPAAARDFYGAAFDLTAPLDVRAAQEPTTGFRGYTLSLVVGQPSTVDSLLGTALAAGARTLKEPKKALWGYSAVVQAPDGAIWKVATSAKKETHPPTRRIDEIVLLLGVSDIGASKRFYVERGLTVAKSVPRTYVQFETGPGRITLGLYGRRALAKDAGVGPDGGGSHRIAIGGAAGGPFTDPDGFAWEPAAVTA